MYSKDALQRRFKDAMAASRRRLAPLALAALAAGFAGAFALTAAMLKPLNDLVQGALKAQGFAMDFWRIAMRPGKPLMFATRERARVLGLPGNPVSTMVCALLFLKPAIDRMLGQAGDHGPQMGLDRRWAYNAIKAVGNYGEIFERNLGGGSPIGLQRGVNDLWTRGELMYASPIR